MRSSVINPVLVLRRGSARAGSGADRASVGAGLLRAWPSALDDRGGDRQRPQLEQLKRPRHQAGSTDRRARRGQHGEAGRRLGPGVGIHLRNGDRDQEGVVVWNLLVDGADDDAFPGRLEAGVA